jgi:hypothetical protein
MSHVICQYCKRRILKWNSDKQHFKGNIGDGAYYVCKDLASCSKHAQSRRIKEFRKTSDIMLGG